MEYTTLDQIIKKCEEIKNKKVKDIVSSENVLISADKGKLGKLIEEEVFGIKANSNSAPDFEKLGIELKVTGLIKYKKQDGEGRKYKAKERISLGMINYISILDEPTFEKSHIYFKMQKTLYIFYEYRYDKPMSEWKIIDFKYVELNSSNNIQTLSDDYNVILSKIKEGKAQELSERLTKQLGACTKGTGKSLVKQPNSEVLVKPRAFSWKPNHVNQIFYNGGIEILESDVMNFIINKIQPFHGLTIKEIYKEMNLSIPESKNQKDTIVNKLLGTKSYAQIPNIQQSVFKIKNIELKNNGKLKEEVGLMNVNINEFENDIPFNESELYTFLISYKFLFIIWQKRGEDSIFKEIKLFQFDSLLVKKAEFVYNDTKEKFLNGMKLEEVKGRRMSNLIHKSNNQGFHIRPHGQDSKDITTTPFGQVITKQQYWLNGNEVEDVIKFID